MFILEYVFDKASTEADDVYSDSIKDSYYLNKGNNMESLRLHRRKRVCACDTRMHFK